MCHRAIVLLAGSCCLSALLAQDGSSDKLKGSSDKAQDVFDHQMGGGTRASTHQPDSALTAAEVQVLPEFYGGEVAMYNYMAKHFHYPDSLADRGVGGKVFVEFVVSSSGKVGQVKVVRPAEPAMDVEAVRVIASMPPWKPGMLNGRPVPVRLIMPVRYEPR